MDRCRPAHCPRRRQALYLNGTARLRGTSIDVEFAALLVRALGRASPVNDPARVATLWLRRYHIDRDVATGDDLRALDGETSPGYHARNTARGLEAPVPGVVA